MMNQQEGSAMQTALTYFDACPGHAGMMEAIRAHGLGEQMLYAMASLREALRQDTKTEMAEENS